MSNKKTVYKFLFCILSSICAALIISLGTAVLYYIRGEEYKGKINIKDEWIYEKGLVDERNETYIVSEWGGEIEVRFPEKVYIHKLQYQYKTAQNSEKGCEIKFYTENDYGADSEESINDIFFRYMPRSVVNVNEKVSKIVLTFPKESPELEVSEFIIDNSFKWNPFLAGIVAVIVFLILFLLVFHRENGVHPGIAAFVCIFILGTCMLCLQPPYCSGWDEEIHFQKSYNMAVTFDHGRMPGVISYLTSNYAWLDFHHEASAEERMDMIKIMNHMGELRETTAMEAFRFEIYSIGYLWPAIGVSVGKFMRLPFYFVWILGKFSNLLLYAIGMSVAISIVPIGKRLLTAISLFPTMLFLSTTYSYDITVIVFLTIGTCIWIREIMDTDMKFSYKWRIAYFACMIIGCMPKAVYAPLILGAFFMPSSKFYNTKDRYIFKGSVVLCFGLLMSTFVLPALFAPTGKSDLRGGNTSVSGQLSNIMHNPLSYAVILMRNIKGTLVRYVTGDMFNNMAYWGAGTMATCYSISVACTAITDTYGEPNKKLPFRFKAVSLLTILTTVVLIWTAMYLSFTEVGQTKIAGVQGRYYLPFIFLFYLLVRSDKIENKFRVEQYQGFITGIFCILMMSQIVTFFFLSNCI